MSSSLYKVSKVGGGQRDEKGAEGGREDEGRRMDGWHERTTGLSRDLALRIRRHGVELKRLRVGRKEKMEEEGMGVSFSLKGRTWTGNWQEADIGRINSREQGGVMG